MIIDFLKPIFSIVDKIIPDAKQAAEAKQKLVELSQQQQLVEFQELSKVIVAEAQGQSWLQRNWRPLIMMEFGAILFNNFILSPFLIGFGVHVAMLPIPPEMWVLMQLGLSGYIVSRGIENSIRNWKSSKGDE